jgi:hypothetical protein
MLQYFEFKKAIIKQIKLKMIKLLFRDNKYSYNELQQLQFKLMLYFRAKHTPEARRQKNGQNCQ